jgi:MFS family permease
MGLYMVIESWLNQLAGSCNRGRVFSVYMVLSYLGVGLGQLLLSVGDVQSLEPFMVAGIFLSVSLVPVAVTNSVQPEMPEKEHHSILNLIRKSPLGIIGCFSAGLITGSFYAMGPAFASQSGLTTPETARFMASAILGGLALQWPIGMLSDHIDRTIVLCLLGIAVASAALSIVWIGRMQVGPVFPGVVFFGGATFALYPVAVARAYDLFDGEDLVAVSSALLLAYGLGAAAGPIVSSLTMAAMNTPYGLFYFCAVVGAAYGAVSLYSRQQQKIERVPVADQTDFMPMKRTSPVAVQIDPRAGLDAGDMPDSCGQHR